MKARLKLVLVPAGMAFLAAGLSYAQFRFAQARAERGLKSLAARSKARAASTFDPAMLAGLPEIAKRYFSHAIRIGTPLRRAVRLRMAGTFLLGNRQSYQEFEMQARQVLAPPTEFVWMPRMKAGMLRISGFDSLAGGSAMTRFWVNGLVSVANVRSSLDVVRSALTRAAMEAVWAPASLLPANGVRWEQAGPDVARLHFKTGVEPVEMTLAPDGRVLEVATMRWSDANPDKSFRLQPFGGTAEAEAEFGGFTIPARLKVGNQYGTREYLPFFQVRLLRAEYL